MKRWCAAQERSSFEVTQKLISWNIDKNMIPQVIQELRDENFLNDERFAEEFARGKFRMKNWGRNKIRLSLKQKRVSDIYIDAAIKQIDEAEYIESIEKIAIKKNKLFPPKLSAFERKGKLYQFLLSKGFENDLVHQVIEEIIEE